MCIAAVLASAPARDARARGIVIVPTGGEPPCGQPAALAKAVARDTGTPARVVDQAAGGETRVRVIGDDLFVVVEIERGGDRAGTALDAPACDAVPDVVAAFVASVLATPPAAPPAGVAPPAPVPAAPTTCGGMTVTPGSPCERAPFLPVAFDGRIRQQRLALVVSIEEVIFGATLAGYTLRNGVDDLGDSEWLALGAGAVWLGSGVWSSIEYDEPHGPSIAAVGGLVGLGTASLAVGVVGEVRDRNDETVLSDERHDGMLIAAASFYATAAVAAYEYWAYPPLDERRLAAPYRRVATPERRAALTPDDVERIEAELLRRRERLPTWKVTAPLWIGSALAFGDALLEDDDAERTLSAVAGLGLAAAAGLTHLRDLDRPGWYYQLLLTRSGIGFAGSW